jgi:hypothetical protein
VVGEGRPLGSDCERSEAALLFSDLLSLLTISAYRSAWLAIPTQLRQRFLRTWAAVALWQRQQTTAFLGPTAISLPAGDLCDAGLNTSVMGPPVKRRRPVLLCWLRYAQDSWRADSRYSDPVFCWSRCFCRDLRRLMRAFAMRTAALRDSVPSPPSPSSALMAATVILRRDEWAASSLGQEMSLSSRDNSSLLNLFGKSSLVYQGTLHERL